MLKCLYEAKSLCLEGCEEACPQHGAAGVQRQIESGDAGVGCGQSGVVRGSDGDAGRRLVRLCVGWEGGATGPEVEQLLSLPHTHPLHHRPEPRLEPHQSFLLFLCAGADIEGRGRHRG